MLFAKSYINHKEKDMNTLDTEYRINERGTIEEEIHQLEIDAVIQSLQEIDKEIEKLLFKISISLSDT